MRSKRFGRSAWTFAMLLSVGVALFSYRYVVSTYSLLPNIIANPHAAFWLPPHAATAATALLIGAFQLLPGMRARRPKLHRWIGRTYVACCLVGSASGFVLAMGSTAGPVTMAGFGTLALFWFYATARGWQLAVAGRFAEHRRWMIRSWAMTFAAVTLRLYVPLSGVMGFAFLDAYRVISWLCWTGNLLVAEIYLAATLRPQPQPVQPIAAT